MQLSKLCHENRKAENALSELTAEQARVLTSNSQMKRNCQMTINKMEEDHSEEVKKLRLGRVLNFDQTQHAHPEFPR